MSIPSAARTASTASHSLTHRRVRYVQPEARPTASSFPLALTSVPSQSLPRDALLDAASRLNRLEPLYETLEARITKLETQFTKLEARVTKLEDEKVERQELFKRPENAGLLAKSAFS